MTRDDASRVMSSGPIDTPDTPSADDASPMATSSAGLKSLLTRFKAARTERDEAAIGSPEWFAADDDIRQIQHEIFVVRLDDQVYANADSDPFDDQ